MSAVYVPLTLQSAPRARLALVTMLLPLKSQQNESMMLCCTIVYVLHALEEDFTFALQQEGISRGCCWFRKAFNVLCCTHLSGCETPFYAPDRYLIDSPIATLCQALPAPCFPKTVSGELCRSTLDSTCSPLSVAALYCARLQVVLHLPNAVTRAREDPCFPEL